MHDEYWRDVIGFTGFYEVSNLGRVRRIDTGLMKCPVTTPKGYHRINLKRLGEHRMKFVHRLVVEAFIGPIPRDMQVNHMDGDKTNNSVYNLEIVTPRGNMLHAMRHGLRNNADKLSYNKARLIRAAEGQTDNDLAAAFGVDRSTINRIRNNHTWLHV